MNRLTGMQGELAGLREGSPDAVAGYLMILDEDAAGLTRNTSKHNGQSIADDIGARCLRSSNPYAQRYNAGCMLVVSRERRSCRSACAPGVLPYAWFLDQLVADWEAAQVARRTVAVDAGDRQRTCD